MGRSRASAKQAGSRHERAIADYLAEHVDDRIDRRVKTGAADKGDLGGVRTALGGKVALECKDYGGQLKVSTWIREAHVEANNDDAVAGIVVAKRRGVTDPGSQIVLMTVDDLIVLLGKDRPKPISI